MIDAPGVATGGTAPRRDRGKREQILRVATDVFLETGYAAASMDRIAQAAGVSKVTIYNHYASKEALFTEIVMGLCDRMMAPLDEAAAAEPVEVTLRRIAKSLLDQLRDERLTALFRLVIAETPKFPALGHAYFKAGPERAVATLAAWLEARSQEGLLTVEQPRCAAELFFGMVGGTFKGRRLLLPHEPIDDAAYARHVDHAVALFLRGCRAAEQAPAPA